MGKTKVFPQEVVSGALYESQNQALQLLETGKWVADGKYQVRDIIFQEVGTGLCWCYTEARSGSPFSDYTYDTEWSEEFALLCVEKAEKIVTYWKSVIA